MGLQSGQTASVADVAAIRLTSHKFAVQGGTTAPAHQLTLRTLHGICRDTLVTQVGGHCLQFWLLSYTNWALTANSPAASHMGRKSSILSFVTVVPKEGKCTPANDGKRKASEDLDRRTKLQKVLGDGTDVKAEKHRCFMPSRLTTPRHLLDGLMRQQCHAGCSVGLPQKRL